MLAASNSDLASRWSRLRGEKPAMRIRDAASTLGVSEAELVALGVGTTATPLKTDWRAILNEMPGVGRVMCLTRNDHCVHERHGRFEDVQVANAHAGVVLGADIDLRVFLSQWKLGFAVREPIRSGERASLQFFDKSGNAVHKIYATDETDRAAFDALIARHTAEPASFAVEPVKPDTPDRSDSEIDLDGLRAAWRGMKDTHEFFGMLHKFKVGRVQALRLVGHEFARELPARSLRQAMEQASQAKMPIMIFVGSPGCIQIHTGPIERLVETHGWFNVLDPAFNLHLREAGVARVFTVRKPTEDGVVTSVEAFDSEGRTILLMFGARKPGRPELEEWRGLVSRLEMQAAS